MTAATDLIFNAEKPKVKPLGFLPTIDEWPSEDFKYADIRHVYGRTTDLVRKIIDAAPLRGTFKFILVDIKVQDLVPGVISCIPGWHLDGVPMSNDLHHLCVLNGPLTEFIAEPVRLIEPKKELIPDDVQVMRIAPDAINTFTSWDWHRGVEAADKPTRRLLVRVTETDKIRPRNAPHAPSVGAITR